MRIASLVSCLVALALASDARAEQNASPAAPAKKPSSSAVPSLGLGDMGKPIPKGDGVRGPSAETLAPEATLKTRPDASYEVVSVEHAKSYGHSSTGVVRKGPALTEVGLGGWPQATETFATLLRIRSKERQSAIIDLVVLDPRGDTAMNSTGELRFSGKTGDISEYVVDWESTPARSAGAFSLWVRVAGKPLGTWPLKVVATGK